jgi:mannitol/fructose-specific phosphotransferase system IIA component
VSILSPQTIRLQLSAQSKEQAIRLAGELLVAEKYVAPQYILGMLAREDISSNYIGNGVAIPHGRSEDLQYVYQAGVSVVQLPEGIEWEPGEKAHLVLGLAVTPGDLSAFLANLVEVLRNPLTIQEMLQTDDPQVILAALTGKT